MKLSTQDGFSHGRVLVLDGDPDTAESLTTLLGLQGFDARAPRTGETAAAAVDAFRPGVVVLDVAGHRLDGHAVIAGVNLRPAAGRPALVVVTGWTDAETGRRLAAAGVTRVFLKPVDPAPFARLLDSLCVE